MTAHGIVREPYGIVFQEEAAFKDVYGGETGVVFLECLRIRPRDRESKTAIVFSHPTGRGAWLPICTALARAGLHVVFVGTRYAGSDNALIMEKCAVDLGQGIADMKKRFGYERIVLGGWSGGGSLSLFYQEQALYPSVTATPAGDGPDLTRQTLPPADAILLLAAHVSRAVTLTEWLDASIIDEADPFNRDMDLDLYDPLNPNQPPYTPEFLETYRAAQILRNDKITAWAEDMLEERVRTDGPGAEFGFVVHGTMAAPVWLDPTVDPSDRQPGICYLGDPKTVNMGPVGLARFTTLRSWLSQWSHERSNANGLKNAPHTDVPALVVSNSADTACTPSHALRLFEALNTRDKSLVQIQGATHYYAGQPEHLAQCVATVAQWLTDRGLETVS